MDHACGFAQGIGQCNKRYLERVVAVAANFGGTAVWSV